MSQKGRTNTLQKGKILFSIHLMVFAACLHPRDAALDPAKGDLLVHVLVVNFKVLLHDPLSDPQVSSTSQKNVRLSEQLQSKGFEHQNS